jgi:hypothetical protein
MFGNPIIQSTLLPFAVCALLVGVLRLTARAAATARVGAVSIPIAFLVVTGTVFGAPAFPPPGAVQKLPYVVGVGVALGFLLDLLRPGEPLRRLGCDGWLLAALLWLAAPRLEHPSAPFLLTLACSFIAGLVVLSRVEVLHGEDNLGPALVCAACLGLAAMALSASSAAIFQLALALAFAIAGFFAWNWPHRRDAYGSLLLIGGAGTLFALAMQLLLFSAASPLVLAMLVLVFFADAPVRRLWPRSGPWRARLLPWYALIAGLAPSALALLIASFFGTADDAYY